MPNEIREVAPGKSPRTVVTEAGRVLEVPSDWSLLPPGDAALSRRIKKEGPHWVVKEKRGRRVFSGGIWAPTGSIEKLGQALELERANPAYERKLEAGRKRRAQEELKYAAEFEASVLGFLRFSDEHLKLARKMARAVTAHAVPVGSGTVARTKRISVERRAEAAVIAWMRHQTTAYDHMSIPRVKGMRRELRRMLADRSRQLLGQYRTPHKALEADCPLRRALDALPPL